MKYLCYCNRCGRFFIAPRNVTCKCGNFLQSSNVTEQQYDSMTNYEKTAAKNDLLRVRRSQQTYNRSYNKRQYETDFLKNAKKLEYDRSMLEGIAEKLQYSINSATRARNGFASDINQKNKEITDYQSQNIRPHHVSGDIGGGTVFLILIGVVFTLIGMAAGIDDDGGATCLIIGLVNLAIAFIYQKSIQNKRYNEENKRRFDNIARAKNQLASLQVNHDKQELIFRQCTNELNRCNGKLRELNEVRRKFYGANNLYVKYREFIPVSMMYDYMAGGACYQMEGPNGAISLYERDIRGDKNLDAIRNLTSAVNSLHGALYNIACELNEIKDNTRNYVDTIETQCTRIAENQQRLQSELSNIRSNTQLTNYYAEISARTAQAIAWKEGWSSQKYI